MTQKQNLKNVAYLTENLHVWPDFHGNRSPLADPSLRGMVNKQLFTCLILRPKFKS